MRDKKTSDTDTGKRQKLQNDRKADRLITEIQALKKTRKRDVALFVLQNTDHWLPELPRNLITQNNIENESQNLEKNEKELYDALCKRALIRMSNHGDVKKLVGQFRQDYPSWNEKLTGLLAILGKKQREKDEYSKTKRRREERKRRKEKSKNKLNIGSQTDEKLKADNLDETVTQQSDFDSQDEDSLNQDSDFNEDSDGDNDEGKESSDEEMDSDNESNATLKGSSHVFDKTTISKTNTSENIKSEKMEKNVPTKIKTANIVDKEKGDMVIKRLNVNQENHELFLEKDNTLDLNLENKNKSSTVKDSFFLGGVSDSGSESEENSDDQKRKPGLEIQTKHKYFAYNEKTNIFNGYGNKRTARLGKVKPNNGSDRRSNNSNNRGNSKFQHNKNYDRKQSENNFSRSDSRKNHFEKSNKQNNNRDIHPSWAAKKKMADSANINIHTKGNKITFDDNGGEVTRSVLNTGSQQNRNSNQGLKKDNLHPSWAAKKEQKGIQQFSGKKIVFGDDD